MELAIKNVEQADIEKIVAVITKKFGTVQGWSYQYEYKDLVITIDAIAVKVGPKTYTVTAVSEPGMMQVM